MVMMGLGMGLISTPATESILLVLPPARAGVGSAVNDATRELGGTLGVAVVGSVFSSVYAAHLADGLVRRLPAGALTQAQDSVGAAQAIGAGSLAADCGRAGRVHGGAEHVGPGDRRALPHRGGGRRWRCPGGSLATTTPTSTPTSMSSRSRHETRRHLAWPQPRRLTNCRRCHHWSISTSGTIQSPCRSGCEVDACSSRSVTAWTTTASGRPAYSAANCRSTQLFAARAVKGDKSMTC